MEAVSKFIAGAGALRGVRGRTSDAGAYDVLELVFPEGVLRLLPDADTDEIRITAVTVEDAALDDLSASETFAAFLGKHVELAWWMTNHRGYTDAFQLRFLDLRDRTEATCQLEVAASGIRLAIFR